VPLFSRRPSSPTHLPLPPPRPDGAGWPDESQVGRPSFDASTFYELAVRHAYDPEAHAVGDRLVEDLLPRIPTGVGEQDEPYLHKVFLTAARIGAGIGIVERTLGPPAPEAVDRRIAGALWQARRRLPAMQPGWSRTAGFFLLAGFHVVRGGRDVVDRLSTELGPGEGV
jgi:hypothetical protein